MAYNVALPFQTIVNGSMTGNLTSAAFEIKYQDNVGVQFDFTGSPVGTFSVQVSADYYQDINKNIINAGSWTSLPLTYYNGSSFVTTTTIPTSVGSPVYLDLNQLSAPWIRVIYTFSSGSGTLNAYIIAKGV